MRRARFVAIVAAIGVVFAVVAERNTLRAQNAAERPNMGGLGDLLNRSTKKAGRPAAAQGNQDKGDAKALDAPPPDARGSAGQGYLGLLCAETETKGRGVRVSRVTPGSPADQAGLQSGDVITGVGGVRVRQLIDLASILRETRPGVTLTFDVHRAKDRKKVDVTFGRKPDEAANAQGDADRPPAKPAPQPAAREAANGKAGAPARDAARGVARPAARILDDAEKPQPAGPADEEERNRAATKRAERLGLTPPDKNAEPPRARTDREWDALLERVKRLERRIEQLERRATPAS